MVKYFFIICAKNIYFYHFSITNYTFLPYHNRIMKLSHNMIRISSEKVSRYNTISLNHFTSTAKCHQKWLWSPISVTLCPKLHFKVISKAHKAVFL